MAIHIYNHQCMNNSGQLAKWLTGQNLLYLAFVQALVATLGSLYFSEIRHWTPCVLCWYQRIAMYPLVFIIATAILRRDRLAYLYILPLSLIGWLIALYHNLLYYGLISENFVPCSNDVPCTTRYFAWFGFITIPLLSFIAFSVINTCLFLYRKNIKKDNNVN